MGVILTALVNLLSVLIILLLMKYGFGTNFRLDLKRIRIIGIAFFVYDFVLESFSTDWQEALGVYLFMLVVILATAPKKSLRTVFYLIPAILFYVQIDSIVELVARYLDIAKYTITIKDVSTEIIIIIVDFIWVILLTHLGNQIEKKKLELHITFGEAVFLTFFCMLFPFYDVVYTHLETEFATATFASAAKMRWIVFCIVLNTAVILSLWHKKKMQYYRDLSAVYERYYKAEYEQFQNYKVSQAEMDGFRHDLNNHFLVLQDMLSNKQYEKASAYMERLSENQGTKYYPVLTGNEMTDILIKMKYQQMKEKQIKFCFSGNLNGISYIEPMDICIIFSNVLDNAIEACEKIPEERFIEVVVKDFPHYLIVCLKNPVLSDGQEKKMLWGTSKRNKELHGFGIHNIRMALARNNGELYYEQKENTLITHIVLRKTTAHPTESNQSSHNPA